MVKSSRCERAGRGCRSRRFGVVLLLCCSWPVAIAAQPAIESAKAAQVEAAQVKAAYLRYIAEFTSWPAGAFGDERAPIVLGMTGADPDGVGGILERAIKGKGLQAQSRPLVLRRLPEAGDAGFEAALQECHLLFVSRSKGGAKDWTRLKKLIGNRPIVTVGEIAGFSRAAGMIEFVIDPGRSRVTMHIDLEAVQGARLRLSSRLLGLKQGVKIVRTPPDTDACASCGTSAPEGDSASSGVPVSGPMLARSAAGGEP